MARDPKAEVELTAHSRNLGARLREARAKFGAFGAELKKNVLGKDLAEKGFWGKGGAQMLGNLGSSAASSVLGVLGDQAKDVWAFDDSLNRLQIAANATPEYMQTFAQSVREGSDATGIAKAEILAAASSYYDLTGDIEGTKTAMTTFARVAQASGASMTDISAAAASMQDALKVKPAEFEAVFSGLINQGKEGSVTLKDFGADITSLAPKVAKFKGMMGASGALQLGAAFQVARKGFGDASQAGTGLEALMGSLGEHAVKFQHAGVKIFDVDKKTGTKTFRNLHDIIVDIGNSKLARDPTLLQKAFGRKEAVDTYTQLARLPDLYDRMIKAGSDAGVVDRDLKTRLESNAGSVSLAWTRAKNEIAAAFTPERISAFSDAVVGALSHVGDLLEGLGKVGSFLGSLVNIGKSVRGALSGNANNNPWEAEVFADTQRARRGLPGIGGELGSRSRVANRDAYNQAVDEIMGAEVDDKTSQQSIKTALAAKWTDTSTSGGLGRSTAGARYLSAAKVKDPVDVARQQLAAVNEVATQSIAMKETVKLLGDIRQLLAGKTTTQVKIDGNKVAEATRGASIHRSR